VPFYRDGPAWPFNRKAKDVSPKITAATKTFLSIALPIASRGSLILFGFGVALLVWKLFLF
jgi:hypothetical protein